MNFIHKILISILKFSGYHISSQRLLHLTVSELQSEGPEYITQIAFGRDLFRFFMETPTLNCIVDNKGYFVLLSDSWERVTGYTKKELYSAPFFTFIHPEDIEKSTKTYQEDIKDGLEKFPKPVFKNRYIAKDGRAIKLEWHRLGPVEGSDTLNGIGAARFVGYEDDRKDSGE